MMEATFYEDSSRFVAMGGRAINKTIMTTHVDEQSPRVGMKRPMTLDLDPSKRSAKKQKMPATLLTSPDLNMLKLGSPELERMIIAQHGANLGSVTTATPTPSQCMYPPPSSKNTDVDRDFAEAFNGLHHHPATSSSSMGHHLYQQQQQSIVIPVSDAPCPVPPTCMESNSYYQSQHDHHLQHDHHHPQHDHHPNGMIPSTSATVSCYNNNENNHLPVSNGYPHFSNITPQVIIKEEPQTVPCMGVTPPLSPINMENQERIKLERKRLRNRIAASKCRKRKLERIARLEEKVADLKGENSELSNVVSRLREQVCSLKQQVIEHIRCGCEILNFRPDLAQF